VRSGRKETYELGKDTGRYWEAGAANVHWLICTDNQVEEGIKQALARVKSPGVFVEGNSFTEFVNTDHYVMVRQASSDKIKSSARRMISKVTAIYVSDTTDEPDDLKTAAVESIPLFTPASMFSLIGYLKWNRSTLY
jgi:deoxyhypusine synthase